MIRLGCVSGGPAPESGGDVEIEEGAAHETTCPGACHNSWGTWRHLHGRVALAHHAGRTRFCGRRWEATQRVAAEHVRVLYSGRGSKFEAGQLAAVARACRF